MKKLTGVMLIVSMVFLCATTVFAVDDSLKQFGEATEGIGEDLETLFDLIGEAMLGKELRKFEMERALGEISSKAEVLVALGENEQAEWVWDANQIIVQVEEAKGRMEGDTIGEANCALSYIHTHNHNVQLLNPPYMRDVLVVYVEKLKTAMDADDIEWDDVEEIYERLALHSNQMAFAANIFGKQIWKKFAYRFRDLTGKMNEALKKRDVAELTSISQEMEKPLKTIVKIVK